MRAVVGLSVVVAVCLICVTLRLPAQAQDPLPLGLSGSASGLIALKGETADGNCQITLVDPQQRVLCVYHVDSATGIISLRSVRAVRWDFLMDDFNGQIPKPQEIRSLIQSR